MFNPACLKIYLVVNEKYLLVDDWKQRIVFLLKHGVTCLQFRIKTFNASQRYSFACALQRLCLIYNCPFVINNDYQLAKKINADGVHLGQSDTLVSTCRQFLYFHQFIGLSISNKKDLQKAILVKPDYLGVGAVNFTKSKNDAALFIDYDALIDINHNIPFVFIGGLNDKNMGSLKKYNPSGFAFVSFLLDDMSNVIKLNKI